MKQLYSSGDYEREGCDPGQVQPWRPPFVRDYGRVIHSASFRRLQGKTQVFPGHESDFFRNRLTHSLEVAQIAEGIADRLNSVDTFFQKQNINSRLCVTASLIHDLGHPPFGHNGERALDDAMRKHGGFEGNAQSLRIVSRIEKKVRESSMKSFGLNLTFRMLAAILKYDRSIPRSRRREGKLVKGYYGTEAELVSKIKKFTLGPNNGIPAGDFRTLECSIMDTADDIAYSTYDLEDCLKAGFLTPASILSTDDQVLARVADKVSAELNKNFSPKDVLNVMVEIFENISIPPSGSEAETAEPLWLDRFISRYRASNDLAADSHLRTKLSTQLVGEAINAVDVRLNEQFPMLSTVSLRPPVRERVEVLKQYAYVTTIFSSRVSLSEYRGYEVVKGIFEALTSGRGYLLMPDDVRSLHAACEGDLDTQMRIVCDFVAGMTDRYAIEFYARLHSDSAQSIFKPI